MTPNKNLLQDFFSFARNPISNPEKINPKTNFVRLWSLMFLSSIMCALVTVTVIFIVGNDSHQMSGFVNNLPAWKVIVYAVLIGPLVEELVFRLPLKISKGSLAYGLAFLGIFLFNIFFLANYDLPVWLFDYADWRGILSYGLVASAIALVFLAFFQIKGVFQSVQTLLNKYYRVWFYLFLVAFGLVHILNFSELSTIWFIAPLLVLPQLSTSLFLGFIRLKMGFQWSYIAHLVNNGFAIGLILVTKEISPVLVEVMSSFDFSVLQSLSVVDLVLFSLVNVVFMGFLLLVFYYALTVIVQYLQHKNYERTTQLKIARRLSMLLPGLGQDYLEQSIAAKKYYRYVILTMFATILPIAIPFTYTSINSALGMFALPIIAYFVLTYLSVANLKKTAPDYNILNENLA